MPRHSTIHVIPATIFAACLVLTMKVGNVWQALSGDPDAELVTIASAESAEEKTLTDHTEGSAAPEGATANDTDSPLTAEQPSTRERGRDPYSDSEMELLQKLSARREELDMRERDLDMRDGILRAAEQQLETKAAELTTLHQKIEDLVRAQDEREKEKLQSLVKIYEQMKPKDAARIMNALDMTVLLDVMQGMKEAKAAPILANMDPVRAREVTSRLAERGNLPLPVSKS